jgi:hypothetical protein
VGQRRLGTPNQLGRCAFVSTFELIHGDHFYSDSGGSFPITVVVFNHAIERRWTITADLSAPIAMVPGVLQTWANVGISPTIFNIAQDTDQ